MNLTGRNILLGVTGSIAAYKITFLVRLLIKSGASVKVILTEAAKEFVSPVVLSTLSKNEVLTSFYKENDAQTWNNHVDLGIWADLFLIAPATANTLSKMNSGTCDNLLLATFLSARCPVWVAPAMDLDMFAHEATMNNLNELKAKKITILEPDSGELASGLEGKGRLQEPEDMFAQILTFFKEDLPLSRKKILVSAGPTYERIDPVRFIGNFSSGKMGYAVAERASLLGAEVTLVSGPVSLTTSDAKIKVIHIESADEMFEACTKNHQDYDAIIMAAAVADFKPKDISNIKIKKKEQLTIELEKNKDILLYLGQNKPTNQTLIGFALENDQEQKHAQQKLEKKNLDYIILNSLNDKGAGFGHDTNKIHIFSRKGNHIELPLLSKADVAKEIIRLLEEKK